ncbi:MAG: SH3 domain-containing protein [Bauldia sp.]|nr:SH3 domain-containing protein [Bauldia sp.]
MKRRYRAPILWSGLGAVVLLAYVLSQPVPIPIDGYRASDVAAAPEATTAGAITANTAPVPAPAVADVAIEPATPEPQPEETPALSAIAAAPTVPATITTAPQGETLYVSATSLNLRAAPATGADVLELLPRGTPVEAIGTAEGWREVINPATGTRGWVSAEFLVRTPPAAAATPAATPIGPADAATAPALVLLP